jgi:hypothetical protein
MSGTSRCDDCGRSIHALRDARVEAWAAPAGWGGMLPEGPSEASAWGWTPVVRCVTCASNPLKTADEYFSQRRRRTRHLRGVA